MQWKGKKIGFAFTGSHCTLEKVMPYVQELVDEGADVVPILSDSVQTTDTRFGKAQYWRDQAKKITGKEPLETIVDVEPIGPEKMLDCLIVAPCSGNTLAKLANGITDGPVLMAAKAQLRNRRPVILAISTNDGLGFNAKNIGIMVNTLNVFMVPFGQDSPANKHRSLVAKMELLPKTLEAAMQGEQLQPMLIQY